MGGRWQRKPSGSVASSKRVVRKQRICYRSRLGGPTCRRRSKRRRRRAKRWSERLIVGKKNWCKKSPRRKRIGSNRSTRRPVSEGQKPSKLSKQQSKAQNRLLPRQRSSWRSGKRMPTTWRRRPTRRIQERERRSSAKPTRRQYKREMQTRRNGLSERLVS